MAGEQDGGAGSPVVLRDEAADADLHRNVESDGRLVEERDTRRVDESGGELDFHALAEREVPHRLVDEVLELEQFCELTDGRAELRLGDPIDLLEYPEAVGGGNVPDQLRAVAHEESHAFQIGVLSAPGDVPEDLCLTAGRVQQP